MKDEVAKILYNAVVVDKMSVEKVAKAYSVKESYINKKVDEYRFYLKIKDK